jgi:hypothetical protein
MTPSNQPDENNATSRSPVVKTAAREGASEAPTYKPRITGEYLQASASNTVLNGFSMLSEIVEDFKRSDRFFKYKAGVLVVWLMLTGTSLGIGCSSGKHTNDLEAKLIQSNDGTYDVYMVKNEGTENWQDVEMVVNGKYRATLTLLEAKGGNITLTPAVLFDENGQRAPYGLKFEELKVNVRDPEESVTLIEGGQKTVE